MSRWGIPGSSAIFAVFCLSLNVYGGTSPVKSPDGREMVYTVSRGGTRAPITEIWTARVGGDSRRIRIYLGDAGDLCFLPGGKGLVYLQRSLSYTAGGSHLSGGRYFPLIRNRVWRMKTNGSDEERWPLPEDLQPLGIAVSPDGETLAVRGYRGDLLDGRDSGLWAVDVRGDAVRLLSGRVVGSLRWSPDSEQVFCAVEEGEERRQVAVRLEGGGIPKIVEVGAGGLAIEEDSTSGEFNADEALTPAERRDMYKTLALVGRARTHYMKGYYALHRPGEETAKRSKEIAKREYQQAIQTLQILYKSKLGISTADCQGYIQALRTRIDMKRKASRQVTCREHLLVLGDLFGRYARANGRRPPAGLEELFAWMKEKVEERGSDAATRERDLRVLARLFRCPSEDIPGRSISYLYRPQASALLTCFCHRGRVIHLIGAAGRYASELVRFRPEQTDSLVAAADGHLEAGEVQRAIVLLAGVANQRLGGVSFAKLGHAHLRAKEDVAAERIFEQALSLGRGKALVEAYYGLGLIYMEYPRAFDREIRLTRAVEYFQDALKRNRHHMDARFQRARARYLLKWEYDAKDELQKFLKMYPDHPEATLLMGDWYADLAEEYENAIVWYTKYLAMRPDDPKVGRRLGLAYLELKDYGRIMDSLLGFVQEHPEAVELMPIVAQACVKEEKFDLALDLFQAYLSKTDAEKRALYEDIRLLASEEELAEYKRTSGAEREVFLKRFWNGRDPDLSTPVNERLLEHYRRVWYAGIHFSGGKQPWDGRGEVYVRFGEPDHRTSSRLLNAEQSLAVQRVKEQMAAAIYGSAGARESYMGPVFPVRSLSFGGAATDGRTRDASEVDMGRILTEADEEEDIAFAVSTEATAAATATAAEEAVSEEAVDSSVVEPSEYRFGEYGPVTTANANLGRVPWESWVYTHVGGGIEITFTDETFKGVYDYAPLPIVGDIEVDQLRRLTRFAPRIVFEREAAAAPDHYAPEYAMEPFEFFFDLADFRGSGDRSALEVYYGMPRVSSRYVSEEDVTQMVVARQASLVPTIADTVYRTDGELIYQAAGDRRAEGAFVPDVVRLEVPPGVYRLEVRARNRFTGRLGIYRKSLVVKDYWKEGLRLSDLQLAWQISEAETASQFSKRGLQVIPMPTRMYPQGKSVFVYYEVYNLKRDAFGQTRYKVEYTVRPRVGVNLGSVVSRLAQTFTGKKKEEVAVGYEQVGLQAWEAAYVELDLGESRPGRYELLVEVTDLNSKQTAMREVVFVIEK